MIQLLLPVQTHLSSPPLLPSTIIHPISNPAEFLWFLLCMRPAHLSSLFGKPILPFVLLGGAYLFSV